MSQLKSLWPDLSNWSVSPLGRGFFMLQFQSLEDMQRIWSIRTVRLKQGLLRLIKWTPSFSAATFRNTFAQVWVRLWDLGFAFWEQQTIFEIARGIGMPMKLDPRTADRSVGLYPRVLIDVDLSKPLLQQLRVTRGNGEHVLVGIEYEALPSVCSRCGLVGHLGAKCRVAVPVAPTADASPQRGRSSTRRSRRRRVKASVSVPRSPNVQPTASEDCSFSNGNVQQVPSVQAAAALETKVVIGTVEQIIKESNVVTERVEHNLVVQQASDQDSSFDSVPPGFQRVTPENLKQAKTFVVQSASITNSPVVDTTSGANLVSSDSIAEPANQILEDPTLTRQEGEFTPVVSKRTKKQIKKSNLIVAVRKSITGRALVQKGAKHKLY
ncbi:uncharacterized protein LOC133744740 [Rosa rugosa]|uniref:uncharacterized protein LOC133744740 n=1 Tax=Rosa rugosa TaxID=74645 RepID=UPI002B40F3C2|nr:uncharacterized protein LOC133744740 [Rosa rugosa]